MRDTPGLIERFEFIAADGGRVERAVPPHLKETLAWEVDTTCPQRCKLATCCHPLVQDNKDKYVYHKPCTLSVIKAGLISPPEINGWIESEEEGNEEHD